MVLPRVLMSERKADQHGLEPLGHWKGWPGAGGHPGYIGLGPMPAVQALPETTDLSLAEI